MKQIGSGILAVLVVTVFFAAPGNGQTTNEGVGIYRLAKAHADGIITLNQEDIDILTAQGFAAADETFKKLAQISEQDINTINTYMPKFFLKYTTPIFDIAKADMSAEKKIESLTVAFGGNCNVYLLLWVVPGLLGDFIPIFAGIASYVSMIGFDLSILCLLGVI